MEISFALSNIRNAAKNFLSAIKTEKVIAIHGEMGAGKTTFVHAICEELGIDNYAGSPTFSIINEYSNKGGDIVYHLDLYRLNSESEAIAAGVEECFHSGNICFTEWPEKAPGIFPDNTLHIRLEITGLQTRLLKIIL